jgi:hypothetical protein
MHLDMSSDHRAGQAAITVAPGVWIRNRRRTRAWSAIAVVWSLVFTSLRFRPGGSAAHLTLAGNVILSGLYLGLAAIALVLAGRVARAGVRIGPDGILVRGPFRGHAVPLDDAGRFAPGLQGAGGNGTPCPMLARRRRRPVGVWALGQRNVWFRYARVCGEIQPLCDELNQLVDGLRSAGRG